MKYLCTLLLAGSAVAGCDLDIPVADIDIRPAGDGDTIPSYEFMAPEDSRAFREAFDWGQTLPVEEHEPADPSDPGPVDPNDPFPGLGPPALYYAMVYVTSPDNLLELDEMQAHVRAMPLFEDEWGGVPGGSVKFPFMGDGDGIFVYTIMPGAMYNAIRAEALALGEDAAPFEAMVLRPVPAAAQTPIGSVSYDYLKERGFEYDVDDIVREALIPPWGLLEDEEKSDDATPTMDEGGVPKRLGRRIRRFAKRVRDFVRGTVDAARMTFAAIATAVRPDTDVTFNLVPLETDPDFGGGTTTSPQMTRAWGPTAGSPMLLTDTRYVVRQFLGMTIRRGRTGATSGGATESVVTGRDFRVCAEAFSGAAEVERSIIWPVQVCSAELTPTTPALLANVNVMDVDFNILMQAIDGRNYSQQVLGFTPRRALIQAGPLSQVIGVINGGRSAALCGSRTSNSAQGILEGIFAAGAIPALPPGFGVPIEFVLATDIVMIDDGGAISALADRAVPTHEYGHFVLCDLLAQSSDRAFDAAWSEITLDTLLMNNENESEPRAINEGFADWFSAQVAGGTIYLFSNSIVPGSVVPGSNGQGSPVGGTTFYPNPAGVSQGGGLEENYGAGISCAAPAPSPPLFPNCQFSASPGTPPTIEEAVSEMATLFHDLTDGGPVGALTPGAGAFWGTGATTPMGPGLPATATGLVPVPDETIQLSGPQLISGFRGWASRATGLPGVRFTKRRVFQSMSQVALGAGSSVPQVCQAYGLHNGLVCPMDWVM